MTDQKRRLTVLPDAGGLLPGTSGTGTPSDCTERQKGVYAEIERLLNEHAEASGKPVLCKYTYHEDTPIIAKEKSAKKEATISIGWDESSDKLPIGTACWKGKKPESPNQDNVVFVVVKDTFALYGVFDGHGPNGHFVADEARGFLLKTFLEKSVADIRAMDGQIKAHMEHSFTSTQKFIEETMPFREPGAQSSPNKAYDANTSGTTCTMCYHDMEQGTLTVAWVGDSRCVFWTHGVDGEIQASTDHKPDLPAEKKRIEESGGRVIFDGYYNYRVFHKKSMTPGLNMSRAIGDIQAHHEVGLTAQPEVETYSLADRLKGGKSCSMLLCTDGVWEFIANEEVQKKVEKEQAHSAHSLPDYVQGQMSMLAGTAYDKWMDDSENEISDDISGIFVMLTEKGFVETARA